MGSVTIKRLFSQQGASMLLLLIDVEAPESELVTMPELCILLLLVVGDCDIALVFEDDGWALLVADVE